MTGASDVEWTRSQLEWVRQRVLNVVGHELRTPSTTIRGLADTLATTTDPSRAVELLDALRRQAGRLEHLVDELLMAAGVETALPVEAPTEVAVLPVVSEVWAEVGGDPSQLEVGSVGDGARQAAGDAAGDAAGGTHGDAAGPVARVRPTSLRLMLTHLLTNARSFGSGPTAVRARVDGDTVEIEIASPGAVLPPEDIEFAAEAFWRGERAVTTTPGLGLGLAIVRQLTAHEGGAMRVEALPSGGVCTEIRLPA